MVIDDRKVIGIDYAKPDSERTVYGCGLIDAVYRIYIRPAIVDEIYRSVWKNPQTKAEKNQARLKQLRGRAGRWA